MKKNVPVSGKNELNHLAQQIKAAEDAIKIEVTRISRSRAVVIWNALHIGLCMGRAKMLLPRGEFEKWKATHIKTVNRSTAAMYKTFAERFGTLPSGHEAIDVVRKAKKVDESFIKKHQALADDTTRKPFSVLCHDLGIRSTNERLEKPETYRQKKLRPSIWLTKMIVELRKAGAMSKHWTSGEKSSFLNALHNTVSVIPVGSASDRVRLLKEIDEKLTGKS